MQVCMQQLQLFLDDYELVPYKVLRFLFAEINYGGRVTDDKDRVLMNAIVSDLICVEMTQHSYKLSPSGSYYCPETDNVNGFVEYVKTLPINAHPEIFGLHANADITCSQNDTYSLFETLVMMQPRSTTGVGKSPDEMVGDYAKDVLSRFPKALPLAEVLERYPVDYNESMNTVLQQEVIKYNNLLKVMNGSMNDLIKAIKGLVVMSEALEKVYSALFNNQIPEMWNDKGKAYPSLKPLAGWLVDLEKRLCFVNFWKDSGIPNVFWVSGFFFPQAFMTGALQNFARKYTKPIDTVSFGFSVIDRVVPPTEEAPRDFHGAEPWVTEHVRPADGVLISGLYFEGARWDSHTQVHFCIYPTYPPKPSRPLRLPLRLPPWCRRGRSHHHTTRAQMPPAPVPHAHPHSSILRVHAAHGTAAPSFGSSSPSRGRRSSSPSSRSSTWCLSPTARTQSQASTCARCTRR